MILITSAKYVSYGLASEFGNIPPCMLPLQNKRLYEHQINLIRSSFKDQIYLSIPYGYQLPEFDENRLRELCVTVVRVDQHLELLSSIIKVLVTVDKLNEPLRILFGDTLFKSLPTDNDIYLYGVAEDDYKWDYSDKQHVYSGFFAFSNQNKLVSLSANTNEFTRAVSNYGLTGIESDGWLDFGLQNTYYRSISCFTTQRTFNSLNITNYSVTKKSDDRRKMKAEANWFLQMPHDMKKFIPSVWDSFEGGYEIEYFYLSSLASIYVYGEISYSSWVSIINACNYFLETAFRRHSQNDDYVASINNKLFTEKTKSRILKYATSECLDLNKPFTYNGIQTPSLHDIIDELDLRIRKDAIDKVSIMHGDFCFSNILYDFKSRSIKVIDPRGLSGDGKEISIYGDLRYDVAKLAHSVIGLYDFIIAGRYTYSESTPYDVSLKIYDNSNSISDYFLLLMEKSYGISAKVIYPIMINLFLSMLPLHSDNKLRQKALLANALRLYLEYKQL